MTRSRDGIDGRDSADPHRHAGEQACALAGWRRARRADRSARTRSRTQSRSFRSTPPATRFATGRSRKPAARVSSARRSRRRCLLAHRSRRSFGEGHGDAAAARTDDRRMPEARRCARRACRAERLTLDALPQGARVGTASLRREALLRRARPDLRVELLRGNVPTRVGKVDAGELDATLLAAAGLRRLGIEVTYQRAAAARDLSAGLRAGDDRDRMPRGRCAACANCSPRSTTTTRQRRSPASGPSSPRSTAPARRRSRLCADRRRRAPLRWRDSLRGRR